MSVKVGVRVRPYNQREKDLNCRLCVDMMGPTTRLFDADDPEKFRDFTFDYSFWSHDEFEPDERGYFVYEYVYADPQPTSTLTSSKFLRRWGSRSYPMPGRATTAACSPMGKPELARATQWWGTGPTRASSQFPANRFSEGSATTRTRTRSTKLTCRCWRSTTRRCRTCLCR